MEDSVIVELNLSRDEAAIARTQEKYGSRLRIIANRILDSEAGAEECENDTYFEAWERIPPNEPRTYLFAFLGAITRHLAIDVCRREHSQKRRALFCELTKEMSECIPGAQNVEQEAAAAELSRAVSRFLETRSQAQRDVFLRRYWFFDTVPEISRRFGFTQSKVKTMLFRMREALRDYLEREGYLE